MPEGSLQGHGDWQQDEEGRLIDEHAIFMGEITIECLAEVTGELIDDSYAQHDIKTG